MGGKAQSDFYSPVRFSMVVLKKVRLSLSPKEKSAKTNKKACCVHFSHMIELALSLTEHVSKLCRARQLNAWCEFELIHTDTSVWVACSDFSDLITIWLSSSGKPWVQNSRHTVTFVAAHMSAGHVITMHMLFVVFAWVDPVKESMHQLHQNAHTLQSISHQRPWCIVSSIQSEDEDLWITL